MNNVDPDQRVANEDQLDYDMAFLLVSLEFFLSLKGKKMFINDRNFLFLGK